MNAAEKQIVVCQPNETVRTLAHGERPVGKLTRTGESPPSRDESLPERKLADKPISTTNGTFKISQEVVALIKIPLPPFALQREFAAFIAQQEKVKASLKESLAALTAAQKALMNGVFRGD